ncbi:unnamed protein product, partial [Closterium sp. NIES-54]
QVEAGKLVLECVDFDIRKDLELIVEIFSVQALTKGTEISLDLSDDLTRMVRGDPHRVRQVFNNLLSNSIKFTPNGHIVIRAWNRAAHPHQHTQQQQQQQQQHGQQQQGQLGWADGERAALQGGGSGAMEGSQHGGGEAGVGEEKERGKGKVELVFELEDTGCGVPKDKREAIFETYGQADQAHGRIGTGLGLAIVRSLVEMMGGKIAVVDKPSPGPGSLFRFNLSLDRPDPAAAAKQAGGEAEEQEKESWRLEAPLMRALWDGDVLLVMEACPGREVAGKWLRQRGLTVVEVGAWEEMVDRIRQVGGWFGGLSWCGCVNSAGMVCE